MPGAEEAPLVTPGIEKMPVSQWQHVQVQQLPFMDQQPGFSQEPIPQSYVPLWHEVPQQQYQGLQDQVVEPQPWDPECHRQLQPSMPLWTQAEQPQRPTSEQKVLRLQSNPAAEHMKRPEAEVQPVLAECQESSVLVAVQRDLLGFGRLIQPAEVHLGGCAPKGQDASAQLLLFESELHGCGSTLTMTEEFLVYTFTLKYEPRELLSAPIVRTDSMTVSIECTYSRKHKVSSSTLKPTWIPFYTSVSAEELFVFSLRFMNDDWLSEKASKVYVLGDVMNIEVSVSSANHIPLRIFVDSCVATSAPDVNAAPRYTFIQNHGCLTDAKMTASRSRFMPRTQDDKLHMQLDAFRFSQAPHSSVYLTCFLKASAASVPSDSQYKACFFSAPANRWMAADGDSSVCSCCDFDCSPRKARRLADSAMYWEGQSTHGPVSVLEKPVQNDLLPQQRMFKW
ncbi:zona pellucida sperm-binding protein 3-like [Brienomyrus brachyistius]|uniref:zona pellucida sperm-binding protein 3-like n=1 Tax=Brienomyrus brachyistius TaxID=42636 RepID=UPI0020B31CC7|nr:zona pellucida sperm-binding protein 3-like [Brienomyrus brachyistius]